MPVETATYIHELDSANPNSTDQLRFGDDHLRLIKATLRATFPNFTGPVESTPSQLDDAAGFVSGTHRPDEVKLADVDVSGDLSLKDGKVLTGTSDTRSGTSTTVVLQAKAMGDHVASGDHDGRYYTEAEIDDFLATLNSDVDALEARKILAGDGLSGGGNLTADRTLSVDGTVVRTSRSIAAGDGLSGGGNLTANRTLSVDSTVVRWDNGKCIDFPNIEATDLNNDGQVGWDTSEGLFAYHTRDPGGDNYNGSNAYLVADGANLKGGMHINISGGRGKDSGPITISHADTSSLIGVYSGGNNDTGGVIRALRVDGHGHVTDVWTDDLDAIYKRKNDIKEWPGVYTGTWKDKTDFPVGQNFIVPTPSRNNEGGMPDRNSTVTLRLLKHYGYQIGGSGTLVSGTWRWRSGYYFSDSMGQVERIS